MIYLFIAVSENDEWEICISPFNGQDKNYQDDPVILASAPDRATARNLAISKAKELRRAGFEVTLQA